MLNSRKLQIRISVRPASTFPSANSPRRARVRRSILACGVGHYVVRVEAKKAELRTKEEERKKYTHEEREEPKDIEEHEEEGEEGEEGVRRRGRRRRRRR